MKNLFAIIFLLLSHFLSAQIIGGNGLEKAFDLINGGDGNLYLVGTTTSYGFGSRDGFVVKYNLTSGDIIFNTWGKVDYDEFRSISKTTDGFILAGFSLWRAGKSIDATLAKLNSQFQFEWVKNFGNSHYQHAYKSLVLKSGNFLVGGIDRSIGLYGPFLIKTNILGDTIWQKTYKNYMPSHIVDMYEKENGNIVLLCSKGGFFNIGTNWHSASSTDADVLFVEINTNGNIVLDKQIHAKYHDIPVKVIPKSNGDYYLLSHSQSYSSNKSFDICLSLIDENFNVKWTKTYGGNDFEYAADMVIDDLNNIHIVGTSASENEDFPVIMYLKTDSMGNELETEYLLSEKRGYGAAIELIDSSVYLLGSVSTDKSDDFVLFVNNELEKNDDSFVQKLNIFPNPVTNECKIQLDKSISYNQDYLLEIIDIEGKVVRDSIVHLFGGDYSLSLDLSFLMTGKYIVRIIDSNKKRIFSALIIKN